MAPQRVEHAAVGDHGHGAFGVAQQFYAPRRAISFRQRCTRLSPPPGSAKSAYRWSSHWRQLWGAATGPRSPPCLPGCGRPCSRKLPAAASWQRYTATSAAARSGARAVQVAGVARRPAWRPAVQPGAPPARDRWRSKARRSGLETLLAVGVRLAVADEEGSASPAFEYAWRQRIPRYELARHRWPKRFAV